MSQPLVTFGIINCNRLHYLRSCLESLLITTNKYTNKEIIVIDNASVEEGTQEYLDAISTHKYISHVIRVKTRDPSNEFAKGLNTVCSLAKGEIIVPLQGDMQFIADGWLPHYVYYLMNDDRAGCITLDAQRRITHASAIQQEAYTSTNTPSFLYDLNRPALAGAGDVMYRTSVLKQFLPWNENNLHHEGGQDSETEFLNRLKSTRHKFKCVIPLIPAAAAIYTDKRGTNARVRGNRRYGDYWAPKHACWYYEMRTYAELTQSKQLPMCIEDLVTPVGFPKPIDASGGWLKNPIDPNNCQPNDYVELISEPLVTNNTVHPDIDEWMSS